MLKYILLSFRVAIVIFQKIGYFLSFRQFPPPFVSAVVVIREGNKILLLERTDGLGLCLPGGFVGLKEEVEVAALREVKEETGLTVKIDKIIGILSGERKGTQIYSVDLVYQAHIVGDKTTKDSFEGQCKWIRLDEINKYKIALDYADVLNQLN